MRGAAAGIWRRHGQCITWERRRGDIQMRLDRLRRDKRMRSETTDVAEQHVQSQMFQSCVWERNHNLHSGTHLPIQRLNIDRHQEKHFH